MKKILWFLFFFAATPSVSMASSTGDDFSLDVFAYQTNEKTAWNSNEYVLKRLSMEYDWSDVSFEDDKKILVINSMSLSHVPFKTNIESSSLSSKALNENGDGYELLYDKLYLKIKTAVASGGIKLCYSMVVSDVLGVNNKEDMVFKNISDMEYGKPITVFSKSTEKGNTYVIFRVHSF